MSTEAGEIALGHPVTRAAIFEPMIPTIIPITPPTMLKAIDSTRNCSKISMIRAPTDFRSPISRVRSVTDTSIMFMTPIPPTTSETPAIPARRTVNIPSNVLSCFYHISLVVYDKGIGTAQTGR